MLARRLFLAVSLFTALVSTGLSQELKSNPIKWRAVFTAPVPEVTGWTIQPPMTPPEKLVPVGKNGVQADLPPGDYVLTGESKSGDYSFTFQYKFTLTGLPPVAPPKITLTAKPTAIQSGQYSKLTWVVTGAEKVTLDGATVKPVDTLTVTPDKTTTYTILATAAGGINSTAKVIVTVNVGPQPPPKITFTVDPTTIQPGDSAELAWAVTGAETVKLDGKLVKATDRQSVTPTVTTKYNLVAKAADGTESNATVTVNVGSPPVPSKGLFVLIAEETGARGELTAGQRAIILSEAPGSCIEYMRNTCAKGVNNQPEFRIADKDNNMDSESPLWQEVWKRPRTKLPWAVISNGKDGWEGELPKTEAEFLALLKKYGG